MSEKNGYVRCFSGERHLVINGFNYYFDINGELHNMNGPAIIDNEGGISYWLHGEYFSEKEWKKKTNNDIEELFKI